MSPGFIDTFRVAGGGLPLVSLRAGGEASRPVEIVLELLCWRRGSHRLCGGHSALSGLLQAALALGEGLSAWPSVPQPAWELRCLVDFSGNGYPSPGGQDEAGQGRELGQRGGLLAMLCTDSVFESSPGL